MSQIQQNQNEETALNITILNLGGYYLGITEHPQQRWVDLSTIEPILERDFYNILDTLLPQEQLVLIDLDKTQHLMVELFTAYTLLLTEGGENGKSVAKQLYIHYKVLDKLFYNTHVEDLMAIAKEKKPTEKILG
jgi:hypothetical protein